jgi:hypothetical protein
MKGLPFAMIGATLLGYAGAPAITHLQQSGIRLAAEPRATAATRQQCRERDRSVIHRHSSSCTCAACRASNARDV